MYAHQVVDAIRKPKNKFYGEITDRLPDWIVKAQKFHIDQVEGVTGLLNFKNIEDELKLAEKYCRLPYKMCWFDFIAKWGGHNRLPSAKLKTGLLAIETDKQLVFLVIFIYLLEVNDWTLSPVSFWVSIGGKPLNKFKGFEYLSDSKTFFEARYLPPKMKTKERKTVDKIAADLVDWPITLIDILLILNCKSITTERIFPSKQLNKKRQRKGKKEVLSYHILKIKVPNKKKTKEQKKESSLNLNRLHFCRGHFKEFDKNAPLFGKHTGLYWWQPQVRGRNHNGIVMKDYEINPYNKED